VPPGGGNHNDLSSGAAVALFLPDDEILQNGLCEAIREVRTRLLTDEGLDILRFSLQREMYYANVNFRARQR
jgi:hypothetical protein